MNYQEKVVFLMGYSRSIARIRAFQAEYEKWETIGSKITQSYSPTPGGSGNTSKVERAAIEMAKVKDKINSEIVKSSVQRDKVLEAIEKIEKQRYADLLTYRYVNCLTVDRIAQIIGKDTRTVSKVIKTAIKQLDI